MTQAEPLNPTEPPTLPGVALSFVRTSVPLAWGALTVWLVGHGLPAEVAAAADRVDELLVFVCAAGIYAGARWLERQRWMPAWLAVVLLGSARQPVYLPPNATGLLTAHPERVTEDELERLRVQWIRHHRPRRP